MLKEAIEKIVSLAAPTIREIEGSVFRITQDGDVSEIHPKPVYPSTLKLNSLDALVKMIRTEGAIHGFPLYITVPTHLSVRCFRQPVEGLRLLRTEPYEVSATDVPGWDGSAQMMKFEEAMIAIRTRFQPTQDAEYALKLLSDITTGSKVTYNDNGIATSVVTKTGVALQTNESIRPIVSLRPYRTFQEVEQPASQFLIRINERGILFTEADGGMWKLKARETVKAYFEERLSDEISNGSVVVAL